MLDMVSANPALAGIRAYIFTCALSSPLRRFLTHTANYASALSLELLRGPAPELRDFVRVKFKNGTHDSDFQTIRVFGHDEDAIPVTEFIYRLEVRDTESV